MKIGQSVNDNHQDKVVRVVSSMANVGKEADTPDHVCVKNLDIPHISNIEQHLQEIYAAINGNVSDLNSATSLKVLLGRDDISQVLDVATLEKEKRIHSSGPNAAIHVQTFEFGPKGTFLKPMQDSKEDLGLLQLGISFRLGPTSLKQQKP